VKRRVACPGCARVYRIDERAPASTPFRCRCCGAGSTVAALLARGVPPAASPLLLSVEVLPAPDEPAWGEDSFELEVPPSDDALSRVPPTIDPDALRPSAVLRGLGPASSSDDDPDQPRPEPFIVPGSGDARADGRFTRAPERDARAASRAMWLVSIAAIILAIMLTWALSLAVVAELRR
jgi:hypothetical protein